MPTGAEVAKAKEVMETLKFSNLTPAVLRIIQAQIGFLLLDKALKGEYTQDSDEIE